MISETNHVPHVLSNGKDLDSIKNIQINLKRIKFAYVSTAVDNNIKVYSYLNKYFPLYGV